MKMTVDAGMMKEMFKNYNRDYYSMSGLEALLDFYNEIDENMEFDPIAICCDCSEFGCNCTLSFSDLIHDFGYILDRDEWMNENDMDEYSEEKYMAALIEALEDHTTVLHVDNGNYIVFSF